MKKYKKKVIPNKTIQKPDIIATMKKTKEKKSLKMQKFNRNSQRLLLKFEKMMYYEINF